MPVDAKNIYAFDDCSIIHQCKLVVPAAFLSWFKGATEFAFKNYVELNDLSCALDTHKIPKHKFIPGNFSGNIVKALEKDMQCYVNLLFLPVLRANFVNQLQEFILNVENSYQNIVKCDDINDMKKLFEDNKRKLKKDEKIPENDDLKIIAGYKNTGCQGIKYLISEDEHFWGYADLILSECDVAVVEEWNCHKLC